MRQIGSTLFILLLCMACPSVQAQKIAFKTNLLADAMLAPSAGAELVISDRLSVNMTAMATNGSVLARHLKLATVQPELRYWYAGRALTRGFVGIALSGARVKGSIRSNYYDGVLGGAGINFGYVCHLSAHFDLEGSVGSGMYLFHRKYSKQSMDDCQQAAFENKRVFLPTQAGLSLIYVFR